MNEPHLTGHISKRFDSELEDIRNQGVAGIGLF